MLQPPPVTETEATLPTAPRADLEQPKSIPSAPKASLESEKKSVVKAEPVDPLQMDIDEEEIEYEPEKLNEEVCNSFLNLKLVFDRLFSFLANSRQITIGGYG